MHATCNIKRTEISTVFHFTTMISRKESIFHIALLIIVQLSSLLVVSINGTLICKVKQSDLFNEESNLDHFSLLLLAIFSFVASSSLLLSHVELWPKTLPSPASYTFLAVELMISITLIALFAMITTVKMKPPHGIGLLYSLFISSLTLEIL